jgi:UPF0755 protein
MAAGKRLIWAGVALLTASAIAGAVLLERHLLRPRGAIPDYRIFEIKEGTSLSRVVEDLERHGFIPSATALKIWAIYKGYSADIKAGEYRISPNMAPWAMLDIFRRGEVYLHKVTIPEGSNLIQIAEILSREGVAAKDELIKKATDPDYAGRLGVASNTLEGYLFPDTYLFPKASHADSVLRVMVSRFFEAIAPFKGRPLPLDMTMEEAVILASMVEKESAKPEERPIIAGVFINRLKKAMPLASDPTIIYNLENFDGNLRKADLERPSPYNTYRVKGLPPTPICSPGLESLRAAVAPAETDFLYFVSKNDGTHYFSRTYEEHRAAVNQYQRKKQAGEEKSP